MAGLHFQFNSDEMTLVQTDNVWRGLVLLKVPADTRFNLLLWGVQPRGTVNSDKAVRFRIIRASNDGAGGTDKSSEIGKKNTAFPEASRAVILVGNNFGTEPTTTGNQLRGMLFHPQQPADLPSLERTEYQLGGGERCVVQWNNDAGTANIKCEIEIHWEE